MTHIRNDDERELFKRLYRYAYAVAPTLKGFGFLRGDPAEMPTPDNARDSDLEMLAAGYLETGARQGTPRAESIANLRAFLKINEPN